LNICQHGFIKSKSTVINLVTYLDFVTSLVCSQCQVDAICFDLSSAFDFVPHLCFFINLLIMDYLLVICFHSYLTNRLSNLCHVILQLCYCLLNIIQCPAKICVLWPLLINVFINDLCNVIKFSNYLVFADDIKIFQAKKCPQDCSLLQMDIETICNWCTANHRELNVSKTRVISLTRKINMIAFEYKLVDLVLIIWILIKIWEFLLIQSFIFINMWIIYFCVL
jgi:hypothetical protein